MTLRELYESLKSDHPGLHALLRAIVAEDYDTIVRLAPIAKTHTKPDCLLLDGNKTPRALYDALEDWNHHTLTALLSAIIAKDYAAVKRLGEIIDHHMTVGHMPYELSQERYAISNPLYKAAVASGVL
jgi:hypothetical protein